MEIKEIIDNFQRSYEERCREKQEPLTPVQKGALEETAYELFGIESMFEPEEKTKSLPFKPEELLRKQPHISKQSLTGIYNLIEEYASEVYGTPNKIVIPTNRIALQAYQEYLKKKPEKVSPLRRIGKTRMLLLKDYLTEKKLIKK